MFFEPIYCADWVTDPLHDSFAFVRADISAVFLSAFGASSLGT